MRAQYIKLTRPPISEDRRKSRGLGLDVVHEASEELSPEEYQAVGGAWRWHGNSVIAQYYSDNFRNVDNLSKLRL